MERYLFQLYVYFYRYVCVCARCGSWKALWSSIFISTHVANLYFKETCQEQSLYDEEPWEGQAFIFDMCWRSWPAQWDKKKKWTLQGLGRGNRIRRHSLPLWLAHRKPQRTEGNLEGKEESSVQLLLPRATPWNWQWQTFFAQPQTITKYNTLKMSFCIGKKNTRYQE